MAIVLAIVSDLISGILVAMLIAQSRSLREFRKEQQEVNKANELANRSIQRDVLYRYFRIIMEERKPITPEEYAHVEECYRAYHANGGNGAGTLMFEKIKEHVVIDTGRN